MAHHPVIIREATNADAETIVEIVRTVYDEYGFTWDAAEYHADLYDPEGFYWARGDRFWIADDSGVVALCHHEQIPGVIGQATSFEDRIRAAGSDCSLERLYVHPRGRRHGIGAALTQLVIGTARNEGWIAMELWSDKRFEDAHRLYRRFGAETIGERICHDPDQSPEWGLVIRL